VAGITTRIRNWIAATLAAATVKQIVAGIVAAFCIAAGAAWTWVWHHFNPQFEYQAVPSGLPSHFVALAQVFNQIDKDSRIYCTGGLDQRVAEFALRKCYRFQFEPPETYRMTVCMRDEKSIGVATTDQLLALKYFEHAVEPRKCFSMLPGAGTDEYVVRMGKDATVVPLQFASDPAQRTPFCGCSAAEIAAIALSSGAKVR
jgi:hypothetical protein